MKAADPALLDATREAFAMAHRPALYSPEEVLGGLLKATRIAFDVAGIGEGETERRQLFDLLAAYVDPPAREPDWPDVVRAAADRLGSFTISELIQETGLLGKVSATAIDQLLVASGFGYTLQRRPYSSSAQRVWRRPVAA